MSDFIVDPIIPACEISLVAGPSGAGKTRWILNILANQWARGKPFMGHSSLPCKWAYAAADRSLRSVHRTLRHLDIDPASLNIIPAFGKDRKSLMQILDAAEAMGAGLVVIEAFGNFPEDSTGKAVAAFLSALQGAIEKADMTIIGIVESPKSKPFERYENPRQRVSGCAAWGHYSETIFLVEPVDVKDPKLPERQLIVCPRNAAGQIFLSKFDEHGRLVF